MATEAVPRAASCRTLPRYLPHSLASRQLTWCCALLLADGCSTVATARAPILTEFTAPAATQEIKSGSGKPGLYLTQDRFPRREDQQQIHNTARNVKRGVVLLKVRDDKAGISRRAYQGTGFVVSKTRRLIGTAAHIADWFSSGEPLFAIIDGTDQAYRVERVWYHPGIVRELDYGLRVRSTDPRDGSPATGGPDLAVVQLAAGGPDPACELQLATDEELQSLERKAVGLCGYPLKGGTDWPSSNQPANCTLSCFLVGAVSNNLTRPSQGLTFDQRQNLIYDSDLGPGASGGPIFRSNGHVVGLATNGSAGIEPDGRLADHGPRIDCLRELMAHSPAYERSIRPVPQLDGAVLDGLDLRHRRRASAGRGSRLAGPAHTMIGFKRLANTRTCVETVLDDGVPGELIETGVWRGGAAIFMRAILKARAVTDRFVVGRRLVLRASTTRHSPIPARPTNSHPADSRSSTTITTSPPAGRPCMISGTTAASPIQFKRSTGAEPSGDGQRMGNSGVQANHSRSRLSYIAFTILRTQVRYRSQFSHDWLRIFSGLVLRLVQSDRG